MKKQGFVPEIQGLRAIAVMLVVLYHAGIVFSGGYIGVDVFFVISGYLITGLLLRELRRSDEVRFGAFYARRIRRLLPAASLVLLVTTLVAWHTYSPLEFKRFTTSAIATAVYLSNFWFAFLATDYLAPDAHSNPVLHTWSLSVEEQFYLAWPLLVLLLYRFGGRGGSTKAMLIGLGVVSAASFAACVYLTASNQPLAFFGSPTRAWEFGIGGLVAVLEPRIAWRSAWPSAWPRMLLSGGGLLLILAPAFLYTDTTPFPGVAAAPPVLGTALVIVACLGSGSQRFTSWMRLPPVQYVGDISYSLYLWHWPLLLLLNKQEGLSEATSLVLYFSGSFALASLTYVAVENPARFSPVLARRALASFLFGAVATLSTTSAALTLRRIAVGELATDVQRRYQHAARSIPKIYADGCHLDFRETEPRECAYGEVHAGRAIVLFGDSHAAQWFPALERIAETHGYALVSLTKSQCPSMSLEPFSRSLRRVYTECTEWRERVFDEIAALDPAVVVLSNSSNHGLRYGVEWSEAARETYRRLAQLRVPFVLIRDTPWPSSNVPACLSRARWKNRDGEDCRFSAVSPARDTVFEMERSELRTVSGGIAVDMTEHICPIAVDCRVERNGMVLYHDANHLTTEFSRSLAEELYDEIEELIRAERPVAQK